LRAEIVRQKIEKKEVDVTIESFKSQMTVFTKVALEKTHRLESKLEESQQRVKELEKELGLSSK